MCANTNTNELTNYAIYGLRTGSAQSCRFRRVWHFHLNERPWIVVVQEGKLMGSGSEDEKASF